MLNSTRPSEHLSVEEVGELLKPVELPPLAENPIVSILTPNYNYERYVGEAIESAQKQTYTNWEMIICDDGSTDDSCRVIEGYARRDPRVRLVRKQNGGQVSAANAAYRESRGQIVCFLDADDRFVPEKLEKVVHAFRSHPYSGFLGHGMFFIDAAGRRYGVTPVTGDPPAGWYGPSIACHGRHIHGLPLSSAQCLRRESSDTIFPVSEDFTTGPDSAVLALAPLMTSIVGMSAPLTEYRRHGNNSEGHLRIASRRRGPVAVDRSRQMQIICKETELAEWEASRSYLHGVDPILSRNFPALDDSHAVLLRAYMEARRQSWRGALPAYRNMLRGAGFHSLPTPSRWLCRFSLFLPLRLLQYAFGPNCLRLLAWKAIEFRRRYFTARRETA